MWTGSGKGGGGTSPWGVLDCAEETVETDELEAIGVQVGGVGGAEVPEPPVGLKEFRNAGP